jgi:hypothetical protein
VRYVGQAKLRVKVTGPASGKVDLYATTSSSTKQLVATANLVSGAATFSVTPKLKTTHSAAFEQGSGYLPSTSQGITISVAPVLSIVGPCRVRVQYAGDTNYTANKSSWQKFRTRKVH